MSKLKLCFAYKYTQRIFSETTSIIIDNWLVWTRHIYNSLL